MCMVRASILKFKLILRSTHHVTRSNSDWRETFSDHFPLSLKLEIKNSDTDVDFFQNP